jgi:hypothetical protein
MARMDKRLLETLRGIKEDTIQFKTANPPAVRNLLVGLCEDLGLDPKMGMELMFYFLFCFDVETQGRFQ